MAGPTLRHFWQAAKEVYNDPKSKDPNSVLVPPDGTMVADRQADADEFTAVSFAHKSEPWTIVAFKGTTPNVSFAIHAHLGGRLKIDWEGAISGSVPVSASSQSGLFLSQTLVQDTVLAAPVGRTPSYFTKGVAYFQRARSAAGGRTLYLCGHSLGGAIAEFVSNVPANNTVTGTCFASPGSTVFKSSIGAINSLIDENDMIGQFCIHNHVGKVTMIDTAGMALVKDIPWSALQHAIAEELGVPLFWALGNGKIENYVDMAPLLNLFGAIAMGISIACYHMIDHYGAVLGLTGHFLRTRAVVAAVCNAVKALLAAAYHAGQRVVAAAESAWAWLRQEVSAGIHDLIIGLKAIYDTIGQFFITVVNNAIMLNWGAVAVPIMLW